MANKLTVESFLEKVGKSRSGHCATGPGKECDHVVEYQVVVNALNRLEPDTYSDISLRKLANFCGRRDNLKSVKAEENQKKGQAIRRFLEGNTPKKDDKKYVESVRNKWKKTENKLPGFVKFKAAMNETLRL